MAAILLLMAGGEANAQNPEWMRDLEDLMAIQVTSTGRREQRLGDTAAAVYVITSEDIRRSGMTTIPDLLRLVPGMHVARVDADHWGVSARGFNSRTANKLLVMVNGRSVYTRLFSGVSWEQLPVSLEAVDRIEIIRGPGASVWGANAVNGIINIITRAAPAARETDVHFTAGSVEHASAMVDHGGPIGNASRYRFFSDVLRSHAYAAPGAERSNHLANATAGGTFERTLSNSDTIYFDVLGAARRSDAPAEIVALIAPNREREADAERGWNWTASSRWTRNLAFGGSFVSEFAFSREHRNDVILQSNNSVFDAGVQHHLGRRGRHDVSWTASYRNTVDRTRGEMWLAFDPPTHTDHLLSSSIQDDVALTDRIGLTLGTRLEYHTYVGWALQPSVRATWRVTPSSFFWGAVSKADRAPSRYDRALQMNAFGLSTPDGRPVALSYLGNPKYKAEHLNAAEAGYRFSHGTLQTDVAFFYNWYTGLPTYTFETPFVTGTPAAPMVVVPQRLKNAVAAQSAGAELNAAYMATNWLKLSGSYTLMAIDIVESASTVPPEVQALLGAGDPDVILAGLPIAAAAFADNAPTHQGHLRAAVTFGNVEADAIALAVGRLDDLKIASYARVDSRVGWRPRPAVELSVTLQNAFDKRHLEFDGRQGGLGLAEVPRQILGAVSWRF